MCCKMARCFEKLIRVVKLCASYDVHKSKMVWRHFQLIFRVQYNAMYLIPLICICCQLILTFILNFVINHLPRFCYLGNNTSIQNTWIIWNRPPYCFNGLSVKTCQLMGCNVTWFRRLFSRFSSMLFSVVAHDLVRDRETVFSFVKG